MCAGLIPKEDKDECVEMRPLDLKQAAVKPTTIALPPLTQLEKPSAVSAPSVAAAPAEAPSQTSAASALENHQPHEDLHNDTVPLVDNGAGLGASPPAITEELAMSPRLKQEERKIRSIEKRRKAAGLLKFIMCCSFVFMVGEIVCGLFANSLAILTDAAHLFTDVAAFGLSLFSLQLSNRGATEKYSYGWQRAEVVGTLISVFSIWVLVGFITYEAAHRTFEIIECSNDPNRACESIDGRIMAAVGLAGIIMNLFCAVILYFGGAESGLEGHGHGGETPLSHAEEEEKREKKSFALSGAFINAISDCIQNVGVIISAGVIWIVNVKLYGTTDAPHSIYNLADPACSVVFAAITLFATRPLILDLVRILMESTPAGVQVSAILDRLRSVKGVSSVHDLHIWSINSETISLSVHVVSNEPASVLLKSQDLLESEFHIAHTTIQVDPIELGDSRCGSCVH